MRKLLLALVLALGSSVTVAQDAHYLLYGTDGDGHVQLLAVFLGLVPCNNAQTLGNPSASVAPPRFKTFCISSLNRPHGWQDLGTDHFLMWQTTLNAGTGLDDLVDATLLSSHTYPNWCASNQPAQVDTVCLQSRFFPSGYLR